MRRIVLVLLLAISAHAQKFEISFPASAHAQPITGRVFVIIAHRDTPEPRLQAGSFTQQTPIYGADVNQLQPGQTAVIERSTDFVEWTNISSIFIPQGAVEFTDTSAPPTGHSFYRLRVL